MTWIDSYIADLVYPPQFFREHAPVWFNAVLTALGRSHPKMAGAQFCEVGCGSGFGLAVLAASNPGVTFHGIDINPDHIAQGMALAAAAGLNNVAFHLGDLRHIQDLPEFDYIVARGLYSWVSPEVREGVRAFIAQRLTSGGVALLHYLALPAAADIMAVHGLFRALHARPGVSPREAIKAGQALLSQLHQAKAGFFSAHPVAAAKAGQIAEEDVDYAVHDYLNAYFEPLMASEVIGDMEKAGLEFAGSASPMDNLDAFSLPDNLVALMRSQPTVALREAIRDLAGNQFSRTDLYARPGWPLTGSEHTAALRGLKFRLMPDAPAPGSVRFSTRIGPVDGPAELFGPILAALAGGVASFAEIERVPALTGQGALINQALHALMEAGAVHPVPSGPVDSEPSIRLNRVLLERAGAGESVPALASPALGSGYPVTPDQLAELAAGSAPSALAALIA